MAKLKQSLGDHVRNEMRKLEGSSAWKDDWSDVQSQGGWSDRRSQSISSKDGTSPGKPDGKDWRDRNSKSGKGEQHNKGGKKGSKGGKKGKSKGKGDDRRDGQYKRGVDGMAKVGSKAHTVDWSRKGYLRFGSTRWFEIEKVEKLLVDHYGMKKAVAVAERMCLATGLDTFPGAACCPCPHVNGHEGHDSRWHEFPPDFAEDARRLL